VKLTLALLFCSLAAFAQSAPPGNGLPDAPFELREIDMHLHSGMERPVDLNAWLDMAKQDGRKVLALIDHLELYRKSKDEYEAWRTKGKFQAKYPLGPAGHQAVMDDFARAAASRPDLLIFRAWEVDEDELDTGLEMAALEKAELIGFHISPRTGRVPPDGKYLIRKAGQARDLQRKLQVPIVLLHPFPMRAENILKRAQKEGRAVQDIPVAEFRFFQPGEQEELARVLQGSSVYIEIGRGSMTCFGTPACREAMIADVRPLAALGVQFTVSTDNHSVAHASQPFDPHSYCDDLGVSLANSNTIIRELLALRARRGLAGRKQ